jgi:FixJ family two-component response regulator
MTRFSASKTRLKNRTWSDKSTFLNYTLYFGHAARNDYRTKMIATGARATVYAVDDDSTTRVLLRAMLEGESIPVETYDSAEKFLLAYRPQTPGCLLLDFDMPGMNGLELQQVLTGQGSDIPIIFLSSASEIDIAVDALKAGALDFIQKPVAADRVLDCVEKAMKLDMEKRQLRAERAEIELRKRLLTRREEEVMGWIVKGKSNKQIARLLGISSRTVEIHRSRVMEKMQARCLIDLAEMLLKSDYPETTKYV